MTTELPTPEELMVLLEELDPEVALYADVRNSGLFLKHPFQQLAIRDEQGLRQALAWLYDREKAADEHLEAGRWEEFFEAHERKYRYNLFCEHQHSLTDDHYWTLLRQIYTYTTITASTRGAYQEWFRSQRPGASHLMTEEERQTLTRIPEHLVIYRGYGHGNGQGISWTLDRRVADWFACRFGGTPAVLRGIAMKHDVRALLLGGESEVIVLPEKVSEQTHHKPGFVPKDVCQEKYVDPPFDISTLFVKER